MDREPLPCGRSGWSGGSGPARGAPSPCPPCSSARPARRRSPHGPRSGARRAPPGPWARRSAPSRTCSRPAWGSARRRRGPLPHPAGPRVEPRADAPAALSPAALARRGSGGAGSAQHDLAAILVPGTPRLDLLWHGLGLGERPVEPHLVGHRRGRDLELAGDLSKRTALFEHVPYLAPVVEAQVRSLLLRHDALLPGARRKVRPW